MHCQISMVVNIGLEKINILHKYNSTKGSIVNRKVQMLKFSHLVG